MHRNQKTISFSFLIIVIPILLIGLNINAMKLTTEQEARTLINSLDKALDFINKYYFDMNIDGALGVVLTKVQLLNTLNDGIGKNMEKTILILLRKCRITNKIIQTLSKESEKSILFVRFLLNSDIWKASSDFLDGQLDDLGIYKFWTAQDILRNRTAEYAGVSSDECLTEILEESSFDLHVHTCYVKPRCQMLMFGNRIDTGYVLTHRLLYLQIMRMIYCSINQTTVEKLIRDYCSLMLKEAKTNEFLEFPQHDIFLEQVVLCGMEGFPEFLQKHWRTAIVKWQTVEGCYTVNQSGFNDYNKIKGRSANIIAFGCTDHATGLGAAALALNLRYVISQTLE